MNDRKTAVMAACLAGVALAAAACSSITPSVGQYAIATGHGAFSNQQVIDVVSPGQHVKINGVTAWYVPAQFRNYRTVPASPDNHGHLACHADRCDPQTVLTRPGTGTLHGEPGMPVKVWTYVGFEINPAIERQHIPGFRVKWPFANAFFPFCLKYGCASLTAQNNSDVSQSLRFSDPGWLGMLDEVMPHAIDNATQTAMDPRNGGQGGFGPSVWSDKSQYPALGRAIAANIFGELDAMDNSPSGLPFFCGPGSTQTSCTKLLVIVNNVTPVDPAVVAAYNRNLSTAYAMQSAKNRMSLARQLYGAGDAGWFTGMTDLINQCAQDHVTCNIYAGNAPVHP